ncbi:hypothetical protein FQA39_LY09455 [Lamprigera yunnana]|nr:hypothetical protein FQA39_LY09455 [Lamprigera yunnana]
MTDHHETNIEEMEKGNDTADQIKKNLELEKDHMMHRSKEKPKKSNTDNWNKKFEGEDLEQPVQPGDPDLGYIDDEIYSPTNQVVADQKDQTSKKRFRTSESPVEKTTKSKYKKKSPLTPLFELTYKKLETGTAQRLKKQITLLTKMIEESHNPKREINYLARTAQDSCYQLTKELEEIGSDTDSDNPV